MSVADLKNGEDFLLYYQGIDTGAANCKTVKTPRAKTPTPNPLKRRRRN
jgi:hypothetical protein